MTAAMSDAPHHPYWLLRRRDQTAVATLVVVAILAMIGCWFVQGGCSGRLTELDGRQSLTARFEVDVNTADCPELMQLPGIGPKLAERIVESRKTDGPFASVDDLRRVSGIGRKVLERIRPYLQTAPVSSDPGH
jgi:competence protein ComEA